MTADGRAADLVIVGGGVIGLSVAFHCAAAGIDVVLLERAELGSGVSSQTARVVRSYFPRRVADSSLATRSLTEYQSFAADLGVDPDLVHTGFLVVLTRPEEVRDLEAELEAQRAVGVEAELITAAAACEHNPWLNPDGILAAVWSPQAFSCQPSRIVQGYADGARRHGARLLTGTAVTGLDPRNGKVETTAGTFTAGAVVLAAGPWTGEVAQLAGLSLPVTPLASELMLTEPVATEAETPFTLHLHSGLRTRRLEGSFLIGLEGVPKSGDQRPVWHRAVAEQVGQRYPRLRDARLRTAWTGTLDHAPSRTAFIGRGTGDHEHLLWAAGFSGRGLCQAPMTGRIIRDLYLGRPPEVDLAPFSLDREPNPAAVPG